MTHPTMTPATTIPLAQRESWDEWDLVRFAAALMPAAIALVVREGLEESRLPAIGVAVVVGGGVLSAVLAALVVLVWIRRGATVAASAKGLHCDVGIGPSRARFFARWSDITAATSETEPGTRDQWLIVMTRRQRLWVPWIFYPEAQAVAAEIERLAKRARARGDDDPLVEGDEVDGVDGAGAERDRETVPGDGLATDLGVSTTEVLDRSLSGSDRVELVVVVVATLALVPSFIAARSGLGHLALAFGLLSIALVVRLVRIAAVRSRRTRARRRALEPSLPAPAEVEREGALAAVRGKLRVLEPVTSPLGAESCGAYVARRRAVERGVVVESAAGRLVVDAPDGSVTELEPGAWRLVDPFDERDIGAEALLEDGASVVVTGHVRRRRATGAAGGYRDGALRSTLARGTIAPAGGVFAKVVATAKTRAPRGVSTFVLMAGMAVGVGVHAYAIGLEERDAASLAGAGDMCRRDRDCATGLRCRERGAAGDTAKVCSWSCSDTPCPSGFGPCELGVCRPPAARDVGAAASATGQTPVVGASSRGPATFGGQGGEHGSTNRR